VGDRELKNWCWSWMTKGLEGVVRQLHTLKAQYQPDAQQLEEVRTQLKTLAEVVGEELKH